MLRSWLRKPLVDDSGISDRTISLQWFTRKIVILVTLASGARTSEVHALSCHPDLISMEDDLQNGTTLSVRPCLGFTPKNKAPSSVPRPWVIPSLSHLFPEDSYRLLCPGRAVRFYLQLSKVLAGDSQDPGVFRTTRSATSGHRAFPNGL